jgi:hypothetical protein
MANTSKFTDEQVKKIKKAFIESIGKGKTIIEASGASGVDRTTIWLWRQTDQEFDNKVIDVLDSRIQAVEDSLYVNATGYEVVDKDGNKKTIRGDTTAQIFFLKNRSKGRWKDRQEIEHSGKIELNNLTDEEIDEYLDRLSEKRRADGKTGEEKKED